MNERSEERVSRHVLFTGRVQGVSFRYTTTRVAERFSVTGFVRNLPDGRVEMVCEGGPEETSAFIEAVREAMRDYIRDTRITDGTSTGEYQEFSIRF